MVVSSVRLGFFAADKAALDGHAQELYLSGRFQLRVPLDSCVLGPSHRDSRSVVYLALCVCSVICILGDSQNFA